MKKMILPPFESLSKEVQDRLNSKPKINIYKHLAVTQKSFIPIMDTFQTFYTKESKISPRLREIAILRAGSNTGSSYEVYQHKILSSSNGVTDREQNYILIENEVTQLTELENTVCKVADEFTNSFSLSDETKDKLFSLMSNEAACEIMLLMSLYIGLACYIKGTDVQLEETDPLKGMDKPL
jgi:4-carboxymuconolactone decarboxylase